MSTFAPHYLLTLDQLEAEGLLTIAVNWQYLVKLRRTSLNASRMYAALVLACWAHIRLCNIGASSGSVHLLHVATRARAVIFVRAADRYLGHHTAMLITVAPTSANG